MPSAAPREPVADRHTAPPRPRSPNRVQRRLPPPPRGRSAAPQAGGPGRRPAGRAGATRAGRTGRGRPRQGRWRFRGCESRGPMIGRGVGVGHRREDREIKGKGGTGGRGEGPLPCRTRQRKQFLAKRRETLLRVLDDIRVRRVLHSSRFAIVVVVDNVEPDAAAALPPAAPAPRPG